MDSFNALDGEGAGARCPRSAPPSVNAIGMRQVTNKAESNCAFRDRLRVLHMSVSTYLCPTSFFFGARGTPASCSARSNVSWGELLVNRLCTSDPSTMTLRFLHSKQITTSVVFP